MEIQHKGIVVHLIVLFVLVLPVTCCEMCSVVTPKTIEARLDGAVNFYIIFLSPDNSSEFTISRMVGNDYVDVVNVQMTDGEPTIISTNQTWTQRNNVEHTDIDLYKWNVSVTLTGVMFQLHDGRYKAMVNGSGGSAEDIFYIRTVASPLMLNLRLNLPNTDIGSYATFKCVGNTGRPKPVVHLLREETYNNGSDSKFVTVMSENNPNTSLLPNGTYNMDHQFQWKLRSYDNNVLFKCDISYMIGLGINLGSALSNDVNVSVRPQSQYLQIQAQPATVVQGVNDVVVVCSVTSPSSLQNVFIMQLKRNISTSSTLQNVFTVSGTNVVWQDSTLENRPGVSGTGTTSTPSTAELRFTIAKENVACPGDTNVGYVCTMSGQLSTAMGGATTGEQTTDAVFITVTANPAVINLPSVRIVGEPTITALRQFSVGTALELSCTGQIGSDPNNPSPSIRWCAKTATANIFTGLPTQPTESQTSQSGCQYTRSSSFFYNLTSSDTYTQFLCESGYSSSCESGTAKQYVNISIETSQPNPGSQTTDEGSDAGIIAGGVIGGLAFLILVILLVYFLVLRQKTDGDTYRTKEDVPGHNGPAEGPVYSIPHKETRPPERQPRKKYGHENDGMDEPHTEKNGRRYENNFGHTNENFRRSNEQMNDYEDGDVMPRGQQFGSAV